MKKSLQSFTPAQVACLRLSTAGLCLLPISIHHLIKNKGGYPWQDLIISCGFGNFIPAFLFAFALMHLNSSTGGVLNALTPLFTLIIGALLFHQKLTILKIAGVIMGFSGAMLILLLRDSSGSSASDSSIYALMCVVSTAMYGFNGNFVRSKLFHIPPVELVSIVFFIAMIPSFIFLHFTDFWSRLALDWITMRSLLAALTLGCVGTALASIIFWKLVARSSVLFAASVTYFMPIVALLLGVWDGEKILLSQILGMIAILLGVWLTSRSTAPAEEK